MPVNIKAGQALLSHEVLKMADGEGCFIEVSREFELRCWFNPFFCSNWEHVLKLLEFVVFILHVLKVNLS